MPQHDRFIVENACLVLPEGIVADGAMRVERGLIVEIGSFLKGNGIARLDAQGRFVMPGIVDLHCDAIEKEIEPRPNTRFPTGMVLLEVDKKLAACGITTMYHSLSFAEGEVGIRSNEAAEAIVRTIGEFSPRLRVRTKVHARYELTDEEALPILEGLIADNQIHLLSFMDHTPGQGQFKEAVHFRDYMKKVYEKTDEELEELLGKKLSSSKGVGERLHRLAEHCRDAAIPMASHDDDRADKVNWLSGQGIAISEFPVTIDAAVAARRNNLHVCLGAPNVLRGRSQSGNLSAREAISHDACTVLCSDYLPMSLIHALFMLADLGMMPLHQAVRMATLHPARAAGIEGATGSLEEGKAADFIIVDKHNGHAQVLHTFVEGQEVFSTCLR